MVCIKVSQPKLNFHVSEGKSVRFRTGIKPGFIMNVEIQKQMKLFADQVLGSVKLNTGRFGLLMQQ